MIPVVLDTAPTVNVEDWGLWWSFLLLLLLLFLLSLGSGSDWEVLAGGGSGRRAPTVVGDVNKDDDNDTSDVEGVPAEWLRVVGDDDDAAATEVDACADS